MNVGRAEHGKKHENFPKFFSQKKTTKVLSERKLHQPLLIVVLILILPVFSQTTKYTCNILHKGLNLGLNYLK
jgi:hypothetical protein